MTWNDGYIDTNGIRLHYHRTGGHKPPVVLSHGFTENGMSWIRTAQALEADYNLIMVDARGHGLSDKPAADYQIENHTADLLGLIDALGLDQPVLIGHSMGAAIASTLAANHPQRTRAIVLEDPPWRSDWRPPGSGGDANNDQWITQWRARIARRRQASMADLIAECKAENPTWDPIEYEPWAESKQQVALEAASLLGRAMRNWQTIVPQLTCPVLLISADPERGGIVNAEIAARITENRPHITHVSIPNAGHNTRRDNFEPYIRAVRAFLAEHAA